MIRYIKLLFLLAMSARAVATDGPVAVVLVHSPANLKRVEVSYVDRAPAGNASIAAFMVGGDGIARAELRLPFHEVVFVEGVPLLLAPGDTVSMRLGAKAPGVFGALPGDVGGSAAKRVRLPLVVDSMFGILNSGLAGMEYGDFHYQLYQKEQVAEVELRFAKTSEDSSLIRLYQHFVDMKMKQDYIELHRSAGLEQQWAGILEDYNGKYVRLSDYRGKLVVIDAWATWCSVCVRFLPRFEEVARSYKDSSGIVFLSIAYQTQEDRNQWKPFIQSHKMEDGNNLLLLFDITDAEANRFRQRYGLGGVPRYMVIDPYGNFLDADFGGPDRPEFRQQIDRWYHRYHS